MLLLLLFFNFSRFALRFVEILFILVLLIFLLLGSGKWTITCIWSRIRITVLSMRIWNTDLLTFLLPALCFATSEVFTFILALGLSKLDIFNSVCIKRLWRKHRAISALVGRWRLSRFARSRAISPTPTCPTRYQPWTVSRAISLTPTCPTRYQPWTVSSHVFRATLSTPSFQKISTLDCL